MKTIDHITVFFQRCLSLLIGSPRSNSIEFRILNIYTLMNALFNIAGAFVYLGGQGKEWSIGALENLFILQVVSGVFFLISYVFSRVLKKYNFSFYFFNINIIIFLSINTLWNGGFAGGAHYYLLTAILLGVILAPNRTGLVMVFICYLFLASGLWLIQSTYPELIVNLLSPEEQVHDLGGNFLFTQILNGLFVLILKRQFNNERSQVEKLVLNILPASIATELRITGNVKPISYRQGTVMFTDFVGFTKISAHMSHNEVFKRLNTIFSEFDGIVKQYPVEKIKTLGDAYMLAGGVPKENNSHVIDVALVSLAFIKQIKQLVFHPLFERHDPWQLRVGIACGPIVGGVVGSHKYVFDIWGDTVNLASRLETSSEPDRINISAPYYERIKKYFDCSKRENQDLKGKGSTSMYFLNRIKEEYCADEFGIQPNRIFWEEYSQLAKTDAN